MKLTVVILLLPILAFAQVAVTPKTAGSTEQLLMEYMKTEGSAILPSTIRITKFIDKLGAHPDQYNKHQERFLRQIFVKTHSRYLRTFRQQATFPQLFSNGNYNCLTATALLCAILEHFDYSFRIFETNHHIFILVETDKGTTLLETTDPIYGFITGRKQVDEKIERYKAPEQADTDSRVIHYKFQRTLFNEVNLENLIGLLHFNLSVNAYNAKDFELATLHLEKASEYYQSSRVVEFSEVMLLTLKELQVKDATALSARLRKVKKASAEVVASENKI